MVCWTVKIVLIKFGCAIIRYYVYVITIWGMVSQLCMFLVIFIFFSLGIRVGLFSPGGVILNLAY